MPGGRKSVWRERAKELADIMENDDVPALQEGLFVIENGAGFLLGNRCLECDRMHFPVHAYCARCGSANLETLRLSRTGKIGAFSYIDRQPADAFIKAPYMQAEIEMPEGVSVFTVIDASSEDELAIGMTAETAIETFETPMGRRRTYIFRPVRQ